MKAKIQKKVPSLRKCNNRGFVELNRQRIYLGPWGAKETEEAYERAVAQWLTNNRSLPVASDEITISELVRDALVFYTDYFRRPDGSRSSSLGIFKLACDPLVRHYGSTLASDFGPLSLRTLREIWIDRGLTRKTVNEYCSAIKQMFKWAASHEKVDISIYHALATVDNLKAGRSKAKDSEPVKPVPESHIYAVEPYVSSQVWALVQLQLLTGTRAGELLKLRSCDIDVTGKVWSSKLREHKTSYRGKSRTIYFGPKAQDILKGFMASKGIQDYLFSPKDAEAERHAKAESHRRPGQKKSPVKTKRTLRDHYTTDSYRRAITRACEKAGVPAWTPHRLRHNAATFIRKEYGLEVAQIILGHSKADITQLYAEVDEAKAVQVIEEIG